MRTHRSARAAALSAFGLLAMTTSAVAEETKTFDVSPGQRLTCDFQDGGSLAIKGWDESTAEITYYDERRDIEDYDVEIEETRDGLEIHASLASRKRNNTSLHFEIRVPREFDIDFRSAGGSITIVDLDGTFEGRTGGGSISISDVNGVAELRTGGGSIRVRDSELDGEIHTGGGSVTVENVIGNVRATSGGGAVRYSNVRSRDGDVRGNGASSRADVSEGTILLSSAGGRLDVEEAPEGASVSTGGGDILVRRAMRFVDATTGGGDIRIEVEDGWVRATTGAGDIRVDVEGGLGDSEEGIELRTGLGEIYLTIPSNLSIELDVQIAYTRNSRRDFEIITDLDIEEERTDDWDYEHGSPKKHIYGTATLNGGRNKVRIVTTNGDVRIRVQD